jgi:hypothetical protein
MLNTGLMSEKMFTWGSSEGGWEPRWRSEFKNQDTYWKIREINIPKHADRLWGPPSPQLHGYKGLFRRV